MTVYRCRTCGDVVLVSEEGPADERELISVAEAHQEEHDSLERLWLAS